MGLRYKILYKKGLSFDNQVADALSRVTSNPCQTLAAVSALQPVWLQELVDAYHSDPFAVKLLSTLAVNNSAGHFTLQQGIIKYKGNFWVGNNRSIQHQILQTLHSSPLGGHSGFPATYKRVRNLFAWPNLKEMVKYFVQHCTVCQQAKYERVKYPGLLQPLSIPDYAWQVVSLDFIAGLPKSQTYDCILVIVDKFSKYAHFVPLKHPFTTFQVALAYMDHVFKLHGFPEVLISDRDKVFTSQIW